MFFLELSATYCFLIIGVLEANFIEPAHDKQDFERSSLYIRLEARLKQMVMDYWFVTVFCYCIFTSCSLQILEIVGGRMHV